MPQFLLTPPSVLTGLAMRVRHALYARKLLPAWTPPAPAVGVGAISPDTGGTVMLSAWLLGWTKARNLRPALLAGVCEGSARTLPLAVTADTAPGECGAEAALLARYRPGTPILADNSPGRAGRHAAKSLSPDLYILHDFFSRPEIRRHADIVLLSAHDLDKGWNRPFPGGSWRENATALRRAAAFVLTIMPGETHLRGPLAQRRLAGLGKPVFTLYPKIWRLRDASGQSAQDLGGEPYLLVTEQSGQDLAAKAAKNVLGLPPRLTVVFPGSHRFTPQDIVQISQDAARMRAPHVLATPGAALRLGSVPGVTFWTYDPHVVLGPCLLSGREFIPWWEEHWKELSGKSA